MSNRQIINIPEIVLDWSEWVSWSAIETLVRLGGVRIPNGKSGVYEVKHADTDECLTIGKASLADSTRPCYG